MGSFPVISNEISSPSAGFESKKAVTIPGPEDPDLNFAVKVPYLFQRVDDTVAPNPPPLWVLTKSLRSPQFKEHLKKNNDSMMRPMGRLQSRRMQLHRGRDTFQCLFNSPACAKQQFVVLGIDLGIGRHMMKIRSPMRQVGISIEAVFWDEEAWEFERILDILASGQWEAPAFKKRMLRVTTQRDWTCFHRRCVTSSI